MSPRRRLNVLLVAATAGGLVVAAAPGTAGAATSKTYKAAATTTDGGAILSGTGLKNLTLTDNLSGSHSDVLSGDAARTEALSLTVDSKVETCKSSSVAFYGLATNWANMDSTAPADGGRMRLYCTYSDGTKHSFHWGMTTLTSDGTDPGGRTNCLVLSRTTAAGVNPTQYTVTTPDPLIAQCPALHEILHRNGTKTMVDAAEDVPFHVTFTVSSAVRVG